MFSKKFSSTIKRRKRVFLSIIVTFALTLGLGYAVFGSNLNFLGSLSLNAKTLNVYVKSVSPTSGSVTPTSPAEIKGNERKEVDFSTNLPTLTDYYEVSTVIRNGGKSKAYYIDYELKVYDANGDEITLPSELEVTVLNTDGTSIVKNHELNSQTEETFKIKFKYKSGASLPSTQPVYTIKVVFNYDLEPARCRINNKLYNVIKCEAEDGGLAAKYTGNHNDTLNNSGSEDIYYYTGDVRDKYIVKLGNTCWQMLRTTDSGGVKLIYNGETSSNSCSSSRNTHKGVVATSVQGGRSLTLDSSYIYGDTYSYDLTTGEFTLIDTITETWSDATSDTLIGKYTCKTTGNSCTTLYGIDGYIDSTTARANSYTIGDVAYPIIGDIPFNGYYDSLSYVGYMYKKIYTEISGKPTSGSLAGNDVKYENGEYQLLPASGETQLARNLDNTHHYTCNNTNGICATVRYYFWVSSSSNYYIELSGGTKVEDAVNEMLYANNVNTKNSRIKALIDTWYEQNMTNYTDKLEDAVYCNDRTQENAETNGWNKNGTVDGAYAEHIIRFKNYDLNDDLYCGNITDKFTTTNNKAKLKYPVGLITQSEMYLVNNDTSRYVNETKYWLLSPREFGLTADFRYIDNKGKLYYVDGCNYKNGVRPAISLKPGTEYTGGTGTMNDPYVVKLD